MCTLRLFLLATAGVVACKDEPPTMEKTGAPVDCTGLDWDSVGEPFTYTYCTGCHSATTDDRGGAPPTVNLETYEGVVAWLPRIEVRVIELRNMPPTGGPPDYEVQTFGDWLACGAPQ